jgi:outer membrane protein OmpA-like peptidoglycan-associated protein
MASKKYKLLLAGLFMVLTTGSFAQTGSGYDVFDSTVITSKGMPQQNEFWNNSYNFPSKPRNMWEIGVSAGVPTISSDVSAKFPTLGFSAHVRKAFGYVFSMRAQYLNGTAKGQNWLASQNYAKNTAWASTYNAPLRIPGSPDRTGGTLDNSGARPSEWVYYNYKTNIQDLSVQGIVTLNNVRFHKQKTGFVVYGGAGVGATAYQVKVNAGDDQGSYATRFAQVYNSQVGNYDNRKDVLKALKDVMDDSYETKAENQGDRRPKLGKNTLKPSGTVLFGVAFKLGKRINLALEDRHTFVKDDLLDGQRWQEQTIGDASLTRDYDSYNYLSLGLNFNLGAKSVEPLWWLNPLDYAYSELNNPKHMKLPKPVFDDADGDGVVDQLDREPNTPAGCPVNTHGVSLDTDGDGVPDCKDKQLITPTECQPVDADGVGKCPEPECCKNMVAGGGTAVCPADYPSVSFKGNAASLNSDAKAMLSTVAAKLKANPNCTITINGYPEASKASQAVCQKRLDAIKMYLVETEGISADRISTNCEVGGGDKNTVDVKSN